MSESCHSDCCPGLRFEAADRSPGPVDLLQSSRCPAIPETGFSGSLQSCELWIDCKFNAILTRSIRIASESQPLAIYRPRIAPNRNQTGTQPNWTGAQPTQNIRTAILTAIFTIELNCDNILKSWGLWWNCRFQAIQPQGPTDCNQQSGLALFCSSSQIAAQSTQNQLHQTGSQLDCRTTKDCKAIGRIALKLHGLQVDCNNCVPRRGIDQQQSNPFSDIPEPIMQVWSNIISPSRSWNNQQNPTNQCAKCWNCCLLYTSPSPRD